MNTSSAGGDQFRDATKMVGIILANPPKCSEHAESFKQIIYGF